MCIRTEGFVAILLTLLPLGGTGDLCLSLTRTYHECPPVFRTGKRHTRRLRVAMRLRTAAMTILCSDLSSGRTSRSVPFESGEMARCHCFLPDRCRSHSEGIDRGVVGSHS